MPDLRKISENTSPGAMAPATSATPVTNKMSTNKLKRELSSAEIPSGKFGRTITQATPRTVRKFIENADSSKAPIAVNIVPTSNRFAALDDNNQTPNEIVMKQDDAPRKIRIPPITLFNWNKEKVDSALKILKITDYELQLLRHGINLHCKKVEDFNLVKNEFPKAEAQFYTHDLPSEKEFKVVLYNLRSDDEIALKEELKLHSLNPHKIRFITPMKPRYQHHVNYVLHFNKKEVTLVQLKTITKLCHLRVEWAPFKPREKTIVQCKRCWRPGHGELLCKMPHRCEYCGAEHESTKCPTYIEALSKASSLTGSSELPSVELKIEGKCCNCGEIGHFASDPICQKKIDYAKNRIKRSNENRTNKKHHVPVYDTVNYPFTLGRQEATQQVPKFNAWTQQVRSSNPTPPFIPTRNLDFDDFIPKKSSKINSPLTQEELMSLILEIHESLPDISNTPRDVAVMSVMRITFKYLYSNNDSK